MRLFMIVTSSVVILPIFWHSVLSCGKPSFSCADLPAGTLRDPKIVELMQNYKPGVILHPGTGTEVKRPTCHTHKSNMLRRTVLNTVAYVFAFWPITTFLYSALWQPSEKGIEPCVDSLVKYLDDLLERRVNQEVVMRIQSHYNEFRSKTADLKRWCYGCKDQSEQSLCIPTCHPNFRARVTAQYDSLRVNKYKLLSAVRKELWSGYFMQEYCTLQYVSALMAMKVSQSTDMGNYILFDKALKADTRQCLNDTSIWLDDTIQRLYGEEAKQAVVKRATIWRDWQPWLNTFNNISGVSDWSSGTSRVILRQGAKMMLRDLTRSPNTWFSCASSTCTWDNCAEMGPQYNGTDNGLVKRCSMNTFIVNRNRDAKPGEPILAHDGVQLRSGHSNHFIGYRVVQRKIGTKWLKMKDCMADMLEFYDVPNDADYNGRYYIIEAWDWTGRKRSAGEPIAERDWVVFFYDKTPDAKQLSHGDGLPGLYYIEGMVFLNI